MSINEILKHNKRMDNLANAEIQRITNLVNAINNKKAMVMFAFGALTITLATCIFL